ncbi:hypothetical protein BC628DRAFT_976992 [Trametes gibbosa]|nr:hypothetical protein BC628DRAFT_976992 [Trametes gibbosa]
MLIVSLLCAGSFCRISSWRVVAPLASRDSNGRHEWLDRCATIGRTLHLNLNYAATHEEHSIEPAVVVTVLLRGTKACMPVLILALPPARPEFRFAQRLRRTTQTARKD